MATENAFRRRRNIALPAMLVSMMPVLTPGLAWGFSSARELQDSFADVAAKAKPAVVNITVVRREQEVLQVPQFFFGTTDDLFEHLFQGMTHSPKARAYRTLPTRGTGSGIIIDSKGYVLTNEHVIRGANEIQIAVTSPDGKRKIYVGEVVGKDEGRDMAVVKIMASGVYPRLAFADASKIRVGDWAIAIGSPFELEQTVTIGIVSAVRQNLMIDGRPYHDLIQTDAAINWGNSGGPLLDIEGDVIGINTAIFSPSGASAGIGFAIAADEAKQAAEALLEGKPLQRGRAEAGSTRIASSRSPRGGGSFQWEGLSLAQSGEGVVVDRVGRESRLGGYVMEGDEIKGVNRSAVGTLDDFKRAAPGLKLADGVLLNVLRDGQAVSISVKVRD